MPIECSKNLVALFEAQVAATPDAIALEDARTKLTYTQLDSCTHNWAAHLVALGVGRDQLVGILMPRCAEYVLASLAALRAGGAFLVLEMA